MNKVLCKSEDGLKVVDIKCKGRGVVSTRIFKKDDFLCEYAGECIHSKKPRVERMSILNVLMLGPICITSHLTTRNYGTDYIITIYLNI